MLKVSEQGTKFGHGFINGLHDSPGLQDLLTHYKRRVASAYLPLTPEELLRLPNGKYSVSEKIDGELWFLTLEEERPCLVSPRGRVIHGELPIFAQIKALPAGLVIAGELFVHRTDQRTRVGDLSAYLANTNVVADASLAFYGFDVVKSSCQAELEPYVVRHKLITDVLPSSGPLRAIEQTELGTPQAIHQYFVDRVETRGGEGLIIRSQSGLTHKLKPLIELDAVIVAYTTRADKRDEVRSVLLALAEHADTYRVIGGCGNLGTDQERKLLFSRLSTLNVTSSVRISSDSGGLYQFVQPRVAVQINATGLQTERSDGSTTLSHRLERSNEGWLNRGMINTARVIHPVLVRMRDDKDINVQDLGLNQIERLVGVSSNPGQAQAGKSKSDVLRREVWTKESKGLTSVRKLSLWKTNKGEDNDSMPAYVVHWTDYSPSRASPLNRDVRLAPTFEIASKIADELIEENIKKGWNKQ